MVIARNLAFIAATWHLPSPSILFDVPMTRPRPTHEHIYTIKTENWSREDDLHQTCMYVDFHRG